MKKLLFSLAAIVFSSIGFGQTQQIDLPITWDDTAVNYSVVDFGGNSSMRVANPSNPSDTVLRSVKTAGAQVWAGTTFGNALASAIGFSSSNTMMYSVVWAPDTGLKVKLKVEDSSNPAISVETDVFTTTAGAWDTLWFDMANQTAGSTAINFSNTYNKVSIFYDFDSIGVGDTFYVDYVAFDTTAPAVAPLTQIDLPITWDDTTVNYSVTDFGGVNSMLAVDPTNASNMVLQTNKPSTAMTWGGTTLGNSLATAIPFSSTNSKVYTVVYAPDTGIKVRLKVEDATNGGIFAEVDQFTTVANAWDTLWFDFSAPAGGSINTANTYDRVSIFYHFDSTGVTNTFYVDYVAFDTATVVAPPPPPMGINQIDLPITWDDTAVNYTRIDFEGNLSTLVPDPLNASNMVVRSEKQVGAQPWAGTTLGNDSLATAIPFTATRTKMMAIVYSPAVGKTIKMKVEDESNNALSVETDVLTTVANAWDTLSFDFTNHSTGTPALNLSTTYDKVSMFFGFGDAGAQPAYHVDHVEFDTTTTITPPPPPMGTNQIDLPITWDDTAVNYTTIDFGANSSMLVPDPLNSSNMVLQSIKNNGPTWSGTTFGNDSLATAIPFSATKTKIYAVVYSPDIGTNVLLKVEDESNPTVSVETNAMTTVANAWDTLWFDFSMQSTGAPLNLANTYDKISIFYDFGGAGSGKTYYVDHVEFDTTTPIGPPPPVLAQIDLPITWDDTANIDYRVTDFGGNSSMAALDPNDPTNNVLMTEKISGSMTWAGTTLGKSALANAIPLTATQTKIKAVVYSPDANTTVRLKVENSGNGAKAVETEAITGAANTWDTLVFDFTNHAGGTPAFNPADTYDVVSIFYAFGDTGTGKTYYVDYVGFDTTTSTAPVKNPMDLPITWDDTVNINYNFVDFGGNSSAFDVDPTDATNNVLRSEKTTGSMTWGGTSLGSSLASAIPFTSSATTMSAKVYSPTAGTPILLKVEDQANGATSVEVNVATTVANAWETIVFDFSNNEPMTPALDLTKTYDKVSIFYDFGNAGTGAIYYVDSVYFGTDGSTGIFSGYEKEELVVYPNPANDKLSIVNNIGQSADVEITILNNLGAVVYQGQSADERTTVDIAYLPEGMYLVQLAQDNTVRTSKLMIVR